MTPHIGFVYLEEISLVPDSLALSFALSYGYRAKLSARESGTRLGRNAVGFGSLSDLVKGTTLPNGTE